MGSSTPLKTQIKRVASQEAQLRQQKKKQFQKHRRGARSAAKPMKTTRMLSIAARKATRERWAEIAEETQRIVLGDGKYLEELRNSVASSASAQHTLVQPFTDGMSQTRAPLVVEHDIFAQVQLSKQRTTFYPHYCQMLADWSGSAQRQLTQVPPGTIIEFSPNSTLSVAHQLSLIKPAGTSSLPVASIGVLSFASPKRPGGGFLHGGDEQEETIARLSSLVASLGSPAAQHFYKEHKKYWAEDGSGLHDHSMVYSPGVVVLRADIDEEDFSEDGVGGAFIQPYTIDVVSAVPVNAAAVRAKHVILPSEREFFENGIRSAMKERMARALRLFEVRGNRTLVLGAFGCGSSENKVEMVAGIWAELLVCGDGVGQDGVSQEARFKNVFDKVVFALPGKQFESFRNAFEMRVFEAEVSVAASTP